ncbi:MAG: DNA integrity scanning diadenylate cyclase DisA, partial [Nanoarchaeota archaeon]|nr:DNA integrity scanning diadenylate cyclase DisA [Nanoarchaeota archaeon]
MDKKEYQKSITDHHNKGSNATQEEVFAVLKSLAPGTNFRAALDGTLKAGKGGLIILENEHTSQLFDGGFWLNTKFSPQKVIELSKMDGAIILSRDLKKINYANVLLTPSSRISTHETGTRHKAAERTARQAGTLAIAVSERRNEITLYYKNVRYPLIPTGELLHRANENIQLLDKQRDIFDKQVDRLDKIELRGSSSLRQAIALIQKGRIILKLAEDLTKSLIELGREGTLLRMRMKEITLGVERETDLVIKDYTILDLKKSKFFLQELSYDSVLEEENIASILGHEGMIATHQLGGWRILSRTSLEDSEISTLIRELQTLSNVLNISGEKATELLGEDKGKVLKEELSKI